MGGSVSGAFWNYVVKLALKHFFDQSLVVSILLRVLECCDGKSHAARMAIDNMIDS